MAINVKPLATIVSKYVANASVAGPAYTAGINSPKQPWAASTAASANTWAAGVQAAITAGTFVAGVNAAGDATWQTKSTTVGAQRYPSGITAGQGKYQANIQPYIQAISALTLPPRNPKGDPANINRVSAVDTALHNLKLQIK